MADLERTSYVAAVVSLPFTVIQTLMTVLGYLPALNMGARGAPKMSSMSRLPESGLEGGLQSPAADTVAAWGATPTFSSLIAVFPVQPEPAISDNVVATLVVVLLNVTVALTVAGIVLRVVERKTSGFYVVTSAIFGGLAAFHAEFLVRKFVFGRAIASQPGDWMSETRGFFLLFWAIWVIYASVLHLEFSSSPRHGDNQQDERQGQLTMFEQRNVLPAPRVMRDHASKEKAWLSFSFGFFVLQVLLLWNADDLQDEWAFLLLSVPVFFLINFLCVKISRWSRTGPHV